MKLLTGMLCAFLISASAAIAEEASPKIVFQLNENRGMWTSNASPRKVGGLNLVYYSLGYIAPTYGLTFLGSHADLFYGNSGANSEGDFRKQVVLDSIVSGYYIFKKVYGFDIRGGVDINLPTGYSAFSETELNTVNIDGVTGDLNMVTSLGKGLNIAPNFVASRVFSDKMALGIGGRYEKTGEYDPTSDTENDNYDPGDTLTLMLSTQYLFSKKTMLLLDFDTTWSTRDIQNDEYVYKTGETFNFAVKLIRSHDTFRITYSASYGTQAKNQSTGSGQIATEERNSNNNRYEFFTNLNYPISKKVILNGILGYKNVLPNGYEGSNASYDGGFNKIYGGGGLTYTVSNSLFLTVDLRGFHINNKGDADETSDTLYDGVNLDIGFVYSFPYKKGSSGKKPKKSPLAKTVIQKPETTSATTLPIEKFKTKSKGGEEKEFMEKQGAALLGSPAEKDFEHGSSAYELKKEVMTRIINWAKARSERDAEKFISFYDRLYTGLEDKSPAGWRSTTVHKIKSEKWIKVTLDNIDVDFQWHKRAVVTLTHKYSSSNHAQKSITDKKITLVKKDGQWLIIKEETR